MFIFWMPVSAHGRCPALAQEISVPAFRKFDSTPRNIPSKSRNSPKADADESLSRGNLRPLGDTQL